MSVPPLRFPLLFVFALCLVTSLLAQPAMPPANLGIDESNLTTLHGTVYPLVGPEYDQGVVTDDFSVDRLLLMVGRPADREQNLQQFLRDVHASGSPIYHHWVTPDEFGERFGAADQNLQLITGWLQSHGLRVARVTKSKSMIEFSGTAGQIREALHTEIHQYNVQGKTFYANASEISVPRAIASRIEGFAPLNSFPLDSYAKLVGGGTMNRANHRVAPQFTLSENGAPFYALGPEDFATQYDLAPVYSAGINGTGETIGIIGRNNLNLALVDAYRKLFNLPADHTEVVIDGQDPGDGESPNVEGYLDVEVSGAIAPNATIDFYIAGAEAESTIAFNSLTLAALRAVEDNQATVLSVSYGTCEQSLGEAGNQLWASLWEQAAAQGQTVFVSSGDTGPTTCQPLVETQSGFQLLNSVNVNGLSSTPWNVSVGGTDFYYSDYASGAPSAATLWNQTNDASNGSLKAPLPEQVWDNAFGFNVNSFFPPPGASSFSYSFPTTAGGGGVSNCSQETVPTTTIMPTCIAGYSKPSWQNAPGVPDDGARDLPDVSLFAADGPNLSAAPICAEPGDCAPVSSGDPQITLVGGTSVSSPSMAGIFALINQKYGRQGQANYTLYALARQYPKVFHDITMTTNDVVCGSVGTSDCDVPVPNQSFYFDSYGVYAAGPGYDLASGLGSLDVNQLVNNWNKVVYAPTTTTLDASPANFVHGSAVTVTVAVKATSGTAIPTGNVVFEASPGTTIPANVPLALANGSASASLENLPGGSYDLTAQYEGDGNFAASVSALVSLTVTPEASATVLTDDYLVAPTSNPLPKGEVPLGVTPSFVAVPASLATKTTGRATGTVTFTDGGTTASVLLDGNGVATWRPQSFAVGAHSVMAAYSGDASYQPSTSPPVTLTVVKSAPSFLVVADAQYIGCAQGLNGCGSSGGAVYLPGSNMVLSVVLNGTSTLPPTGAVTVNFGPLTQTVDLTAVSGVASAWVTFANVPAGTYTLSASYPGDANWNAASFNNPSPFVYAAPGDTPTTTTTTLALSPSSVDSSGSVTFKVASQPASSQNGCFIGNSIATLYANGVSFGFIPMSCNVVNGVVTVSGSATIPGSELPSGSYQVVAEYMGGVGIQQSSFSSPLPLTVTVTDFSLSVVGKNLSVPSGESITVPVALGGPASASIAVGLSCVTSSASIGCSISPNSSSVMGSSNATLTINAFTSPGAALAANRDAPQGNRFPLHSREGLAFALLAFVAWPGRKRSSRLFMLLAFCAGLCWTVGCGSSSTPTAKNPVTPAPAGSYSVTVIGVSGGITHNATVHLNAQ